MGRHVPLRTCVACRQVTQKKNLNRFVVSGNQIVLEDDGARTGRGAYLHRCAECVAVASKKNSLNRALRANVPVCYPPLA